MFSTLFQAFPKQPVRLNSDQLEVRQWQTAHAIIVRVFGELWSSNSETFEQAVSLLVDHPKRLLVVDLSGVTFIGSQGITVLLNLSKQITTAGAELRLVVPPSQVREALETARLDRVWKLFQNVSAALTEHSGTAA